ncbi:hypothetical protein EAS64_03540 [Trebonia kvetii]|uniref:Uncharacterized protein n=1 Tax=Trebonia kvetii TaxID=2480626 RepID=A0A6P2C960_9ACTN|nr:hypothetical protein [Trebonia kvetii]TVZ06501.1 hypothetical protein EAS64_03540 [Trebonia kvetii]
MSDHPGLRSFGRPNAVIRQFDFRAARNDVRGDRVGVALPVGGRAAPPSAAGRAAFSSSVSLGSP